MTERAKENGGWVALDCVLDGGPAARAAIGLIVLANDTVIEPEVRRFLPLPGVEVYSSRIPMARDVSPECLAAMAGELPRAVELLMPEHRLDVVAFGCTSGSMIIGPERITGIIEKVRPGVKVCNPVSASLAAFATLGVRRIGLSPPTAPGEQARRALLGARGARYRRSCELPSGQRHFHRLHSRGGHIANRNRYRQAGRGSCVPLLHSAALLRHHRRGGSDDRQAGGDE